MKILFVSRKFHRMAGGVERMATAIMNGLVRRGHNIALLTWDNKGATPHYDLDPAIAWKKLAIGDSDLPANWNMRWRRQLAIRAFAQEFVPDVIVGFQSGAFIAAKVATLGLGIPVIAAERNSPDLFSYRRRGRWLRPLTMVMLCLASRITVQLPSYIQKYPVFLRGRITVIPNMVARISEVPFPNERENAPKVILNVGRLSYQKNQVFLIRSFALIASEFPDWELVLVGEGEMGGILRGCVKKMGLERQVRFVGAVRDVSYWYRSSAFLALPSLWEGFPNVLAEAFSHGLPAAGLRTTAGVNELVVDQITGYLSDPTERAFADILKRMIEDLPARQAMGRTAAQTMLPYEPERIIEQWESLFSSVGTRP